MKLPLIPRPTERIRRYLAAFGRFGIAVIHDSYMLITAEYLHGLGAKVQFQALPYHTGVGKADFKGLARTNWAKFSGEVERDFQIFCDRFHGNTLLFGHSLGALVLFVLYLRRVTSGKQNDIGGFIGVSLPLRLRWWARVLVSLSRLIYLLPFLRHLPVPNPFARGPDMSRWLPANAALIIGEAQKEARVLLRKLNKNEADKYPPILLVHGRKDPIAQPMGAIALYRALRRFGMDIGLEIFPEAGHDITSDVGDPHVFGDSHYERLLSEWLAREAEQAAD